MLCSTKSLLREFENRNAILGIIKGNWLNMENYQGWATLLGSRATLETKLFYADHYEHHMELFDLTIERKWSFRSPFSKKKHLKRHF